MHYTERFSIYTWKFRQFLQQKMISKVCSFNTCLFPIFCINFKVTKSRKCWKAGIAISTHYPEYDPFGLWNLDNNIAQWYCNIIFSDNVVRIAIIIFYQESNTFSTIIFKHFAERTQLPKRPPKSTQSFQGETFELKLGLEFIFFCIVR